MNAQITYEIHHGSLSEKHVTELMPLRLTQFYNFPYLFKGDERHEADRLRNMPTGNGTILILAYENGSLVGSLLAFKKGGIVHPRLKDIAELDLKTTLYIEWSMVEQEYESRGIRKELYDLLKREGSLLGYTDAYEIAVVRSENHPFRPQGTNQTFDVEWPAMGFTRLYIYEPWPWLTRCGTPGNEFVAEIDNMVEYWHLKLK